MNIINMVLVRGAALCIGTGASILATSSANAANPRSSGAQWGRTGNLSIQLVDNTSAKWSPYLKTAAAAWSAATNIDFRVVTGPPIDASACAPSYGVVEVCSANYGKNGWLGMTNWYTSGGFIVMATVRYNDYYPLTSSWYAADAWYADTSCHELGHALGLNHQDSNKGNANSGSCLDMTSDPSGKRAANGPLTDEAPGAMDLAALADIYALPLGVQLASTTYTMTGSVTSVPASSVTLSGDGSTVPEPATWALMLAGFGAVGAGMRRRVGRPEMAVV